MRMQLTLDFKKYQDGSACAVVLRKRNTFYVLYLANWSCSHSTSTRARQLTVITLTCRACPQELKCCIIRPCALTYLCLKVSGEPWLSYTLAQMPAPLLYTASLDLKLVACLSRNCSILVLVWLAFTRANSCLSDNESSSASVEVDVVADGGRTWIKVKAQNPQSILDTFKGNCDWKKRNVVSQASDFLRAARENPVNFSTPKVVCDSRWYCPH